ncbi:MAG: isopenicillin N synthase family dioxygenase [Acidimicrobiales bacterium]
MAFTSIPIVDGSAVLGSDGVPADFAAEFTDICHHVGFALVTNHGISTDLQGETFDLMKRFFELPLETKQLIDKTNSAQFRGWEPVGAESTNNAPDVREQIDVWTEWPEHKTGGPNYNRLLGPNQWLPDDVLPGHRSISLRWISALADLADRLMSALSVGLGLQSDHLRSLFGDQPMSLAKFIHYPPTPAGAAGVNPHHDAGFLTVLAPGPTPGLQVQNPAGDWVDVPVIDNTFVINLGEVLQSMTGNYLVATPHRVVTNTERYSSGYFHGPSLTTQLTRLPLAPKYAAAVEASPHHHDAGFMPTPYEAQAGTAAMTSGHQPQTYGEQLWNYFHRSYGDQMARHHGGLFLAANEI